MRSIIDLQSTAIGHCAAGAAERCGKPARARRGADVRIVAPVAVGTSHSTYTLRCSECSVGVTMTAGRFNDPKHWRQQADEARAIATASKS